jgi:hypothetical protein
MMRRKQMKPSKPTGAQSEPVEDPYLAGIMKREPSSLARAFHAEQAAFPTEQSKAEPFWHAVVSKRSPIYNKAIRRDDVAEEYAAQCREQGCRDAEVVPLFRAPPAPTTEPTAKPITGLTEEEIRKAVRPLYGDDRACDMGLDDDIESAQAITRALAEKNGLTLEKGS